MSDVKVQNIATGDVNLFEEVSPGEYRYESFVPGTYEVSISVSGTSDWSAPVTVTILDAFAAPKINIQQVGLETMQVEIIANAADVFYAASNRTNDSGTIKGKKQADGTYVYNLTVKNVDPNCWFGISAQTYVKIDGYTQWGEYYTEEIVPFPFWDWSAAPSVSVMQDTTAEGKLLLTLTAPDAAIPYLLGTEDFQLAYTIMDTQGHVFLTDVRPDV